MTLATVALALTPLTGLAVCMALHVVVSRALSTTPRHQGAALSVLGGAGAVVGLVLVARNDPLIGATSAWQVALVWLPAYLLFAYCYVIGFFNLGESARRIRLLIELHGAGERGMTVDEILTVYNARMIVEARLSRLVAGEQVVERGARYFLRGRLMLYCAKVLALLKLVLLPEKSGLGGHEGSAGASDV